MGGGGGIHSERYPQRARPWQRVSHPRARQQRAVVGGQDAGGGGNDSARIALSGIGGRGARTNYVGESHYYHCGKEGHWARGCPHLTTEQQEQLHMVLEANEDQEQEGKSGHQFFHVSLLWADALPDHWAYLDGCSTVTAFKSKQYLINTCTINKGVKINCNLGEMRTNQVGDYGSVNVWFILQEIANIFLMNNLEKKYRIMYGSWQGYYFVHTVQGKVRFYKDKNGLPFIDFKESSEDTAAMLVQTGLEEAAKALM